MEIRKSFSLRGPNIWARFPVLEAWLDLGTFKNLTPESAPGFYQRLISWLPRIVERLDFGVQTGAYVPWEPGCELAKVVGQVALELQSRAYQPVSFVAAEATSEDRIYRVAIEYAEETLAFTSLTEARVLCIAAAHEDAHDIHSTLERLAELADESALGMTSAAIAEAARARGIPVRRYGCQKSVGEVLQLGHGVRQRQSMYTRTDRTSAVGESITQNKDLTRSMLQSIGIPVPEGRMVSDAEDAWAAACEIGAPVVVKPNDADYGQGVSLNLTTREAVVAAYGTAAARSHGSGVLVERYVRGCEHRLLVINGRVVAAVRRDPPQVVGDGISTVSELIEAVNQARRADTSMPFRPKQIEVDDTVLRTLEEQGHSPDAIPPQGARILLRRNSHHWSGGTTTDVTESVHPDVAGIAVEAAQLVGLDVAGLDLIAADIGRPLKEQGGAFLEINASPGIRMHLAPSVGTPRPVGAMLVNSMFPRGETGRIPIVAAIGSGSGNTIGLISSILARTGRRVGEASSAGVRIDGRPIRIADSSQASGIRAVLRHPSVEVGVFAVNPLDILQEGLEFDLCTVAVLTDYEQEIQRQASAALTSDRVRAIGVVVDAVGPDGTVVLPATDALARRFAAACSSTVLYYATDESHLAAIARDQGIRAVFVRDGDIILAHSDEERRLMPLKRALPVSQRRSSASTSDLLAGIATIWAMEIPAVVIRDVIESARDDFRTSEPRVAAFAGSESNRV